MGNCFKVAAFVIYGLMNAPLANACHGIAPLTKIDVAFAEIIFEGRIRDVRPVGRSGKLVFDIDTVVRGDLPQKQVTVYLQSGSAYSAPKSIEDFVKRYGENTRIALTTPKQVEMYCRTEMVWSVTGENVRSQVPRYKCDFSALSGHSPKGKVPFVLKKPCGYPYIFKVDTYKKMENYHANVEEFERLPRNALNHESFKKITGGVGPLPWESSPLGYENIAVELYRDYGYLFTAGLKEDDAAQNILLSHGVEMIGEDNAFLANSSNREKLIEYFKKRLMRLILQIAAVNEKYPEIGERLLEK